MKAMARHRASCAASAAPSKHCPATIRLAVRSSHCATISTISACCATLHSTCRNADLRSRKSDRCSMPWDCSSAASLWSQNCASSSTIVGSGTDPRPCRIGRHSRTNIPMRFPRCTTSWCASRIRGSSEFWQRAAVLEPIANHRIWNGCRKRLSVFRNIALGQKFPPPAAGSAGKEICW